MATANNEFFDALAALEKERGLPADYLIDKIKAAIVIAVKKDYEVEDENVVVDIVHLFFDFVFHDKRSLLCNV